MCTKKDCELTVDSPISLNVWGVSQAFPVLFPNRPSIITITTFRIFGGTVSHIGIESLTATSCPFDSVIKALQCWGLRNPQTEKGGRRASRKRWFADIRAVIVMPESTYAKAFTKNETPTVNSTREDKIRLC